MGGVTIAARWIKPTTEFLTSVVVRSRGKIIAEGTVDVRQTIKEIQSGSTPPRDIYRNTNGLLPDKPYGHYKEFAVPTPGVSGARGVLYYTGPLPNLYSA